MVDQIDARRLMGPSDQDWEKGSHDGCSTLVLEVRICKSDQGWLWSKHEFQSKEDFALSLQWPGGGANQIACGFLIEAVRRETFASTLALMTAQPDFMAQYTTATDEEKSAIREKMEGSVQKLLARTIAKIISDITKETLDMVGSQVTSKLEITSDPKIH